MSDQTAVITAAPIRPIFAISDADKQAAKRLKMMLSYGDKLTEDNALALYYYGKLHGLDPLNGECYFLVRDEYTTKDGELHPREELGCYPGIKGKRKKAKEQLRASDPQATYRTEYSVVKAEDIGLDAKEIKVAVKAELRDSISEANYILTTLKLIQAGYTKDEVSAIVGKPPRWVGYGTVTNKESWRLKQPPLVVAQKRAESAAVSQRFDLPFADDLADDAAPEVVSRLEAGGENENGETARPPEPAVEGEFADKPKRSEAEIMGDLGYDAKPESNPENGNTAWTLDTARFVKAPNGTEFGLLNLDQLEAIANHKNASDEQRSAARFILNNFDN